MHIYNVPESRRYWVVRADSGRFYDHFTLHGVVALGHMDDVREQYRETKPFTPPEENFSENISQALENKGNHKAQKSKSLNQLNKFIYEISPGDWVITVRHQSVRFGIIESDAYISKEPLVINYEKQNKQNVTMDYILRRDVSWGPTIQRKIMPYGLISSLQSHQTVFNLDKKWQSIYHSLYPVFLKKNELYFSLKIRSTKDINNYSVVQLLSFLNEIEVIAKEIDKGLTASNFDDIFKKYARNNQLTLTTKAQFHSPGDIWNKIEFPSKNKVLFAVLVYGMIFGNEHMGMDGLVDIETRQKLWDLAIERMKIKDVNHVVDNLELSKPSYNTKVLEVRDNNE